MLFFYLSSFLLRYAVVWTFRVDSVKLLPDMGGGDDRSPSYPDECQDVQHRTVELIYSHRPGIHSRPKVHRARSPAFRQVTHPGASQASISTNSGTVWSVSNAHRLLTHRRWKT